METIFILGIFGVSCFLWGMIYAGYGNHQEGRPPDKTIKKEVTEGAVFINPDITEKRIKTAKTIDELLDG